MLVFTLFCWLHVCFLNLKKSRSSPKLVLGLSLTSLGPLNLLKWFCDSQAVDYEHLIITSFPVVFRLFFFIAHKLALRFIHRLFQAFLIMFFIPIGSNRLLARTLFRVKSGHSMLNFTRRPILILKIWKTVKNVDSIHVFLLRFAFCDSQYLSRHRLAHKAFLAF